MSERCPKCGVEAAYYQSERAEWPSATAAYVAAIEDKLDAKEREIADIREAHKKVIEERCPADEKHCACVPILRRELAEARELHNMQLAAISTACLQNTEESANSRIGRGNPYWTVAYGDVCVAVDREMNMMAELEKAREAIREAVEFTESVVQWLDQNGHGPNMQNPTLHSSCFACGVTRKGLGTLAKLRSCLPPYGGEAAGSNPVPVPNATGERPETRSEDALHEIEDNAGAGFEYAQPVCSARARLGICAHHSARQRPQR